MSAPAGLEPIHLRFDVDCDAKQAFNLWTAHASLWWPLSHTVSTESGLQVVFEPRPGGRIYERTPAGIEHDWGQIIEWEPPRRLVYLWHLRADSADATEVEIRFTTRPMGTQVEIEHRGWERLGAAAIPRREGNLVGWTGLLLFYRAAANKGRLDAQLGR